MDLVNMSADMNTAQLVGTHDVKVVVIGPDSWGNTFARSPR